MRLLQAGEGRGGREGREGQKGKWNNKKRGRKLIRNGSVTGLSSVFVYSGRPLFYFGGGVRVGLISTHSDARGVQNFTFPPAILRACLHLKQTRRPQHCSSTHSPSNMKHHIQNACRQSRKTGSSTAESRRHQKCTFRRGGVNLYLY